ncbi:MAG: YqeG family HAD IIIA-type phosphatase [Firmicutes bacterium]|nr:YqeG family HAD IIIA-type phosphatase [Bacillota bacterium]
MFKHLCPDLCLGSLLDVELGKLKSQGYRGIILDIDNTVVPWSDENIGQAVITWVEEGKEIGFAFCLASNALKQRAEQVGHALGMPAVFRAIKPRKRPFKEALRILGTAASETVVIGDQLFTDVLGGNRMGLYTILLDPLASNEMFWTKLVRRVERWVIRHLIEKGYISEAVTRRRLAEKEAR